MKQLLVLLIVLIPTFCFAEVVVPIDKVENSVNIRLTPDASSEVVGRLDRGASAALIGSVDGWHEVALEGGATGYISADWTKIVDKIVDDQQDVDDVKIEESLRKQPSSRTPMDEAVAEEALPIDDVVEDSASVVDPVQEPEVVSVPEPAVEPEAVAVQPVVNGTENFLVKFRDKSRRGNSQIYDNGNRVGIGTTEPQQRLEVNGSIRIHERNSSVAGLIITQSTGDTGYIMHNRASTLTIGAGSQDRITIDSDGNVGIAVPRPNHPLELASGAHVTAGGAWTNSSSRARKENVVNLSGEEATLAVMALQPVVFNYRNESREDYVGFIAEDVPELVAMSHRDSLSTMDIVAVLTRVVQEQQLRIDELEARLDGR